MSVPPIPAPLEQLRQRRFSFYPPVVNIEHNEWVVRCATWGEVQVMNTKTGIEVWIPLRLLGEVSRIEEPLMIVGLLKELEYKAGAVMPHVRRVIEMPLAANDYYRPRFRSAEPQQQPAPVIGIRVESRSSRKLRVAVAGGVLACVAVAIVTRDEGRLYRLTASPDVRLPLIMGADRNDPCHVVLRKAR